MSGWQISTTWAAAVRDVQAGLVEALVADAAHVGRAVALAKDDVELLFELVAHLFGEAFAGDESHFLKEILAQVDALFLGLLGEVHQVARRAHVAGHAQLLHDVELGAGIGRARRDGGAAEVAQWLFKHQSGRGQVIVEGYLNHVSGAEPYGIKGFGVSPVVVHAVFGVEDGAGREEDALQFADVLGQQAAEAGADGLEEYELFLFQQRDVLDVGKGLELLHVELGAVKAFLDVFRISVGVGEQVLELDQAILAAFALVEHFAAVVDAFGAVFAGHVIMLRTVWNSGKGLA